MNQIVNFKKSVSFQEILFFPAMKPDIQKKKEETEKAAESEEKK